MSFGNRETSLKPLSDCFADEFYRMCFAPARGAAFRILRDPAMAEDVAQEALWRAWASAGKYDSSRGTLSAWVSTIARNIAIDYVRSPMMRTGAETEKPIGGPGLSIEDLTVVTIALERLHPIERTVLTLMFYDGFSHRDIARRLNRPLGTIKTWMRTALRHLREQIIPAAAPASVPGRPVSPDRRFGRDNIARSGALLKAALEQEQSATALSDANGAFLVYNGAADRLLGIASVETDLSSNCSDRYGLYRPDGVTPYPVHELPLWLAIAGQHVFRRMVCIRAPASPGGVLVRASARPRLDGAGRISGALLICDLESGK